jgi:hypothetical protein
MKKKYFNCFLGIILLPVLANCDFSDNYIEVDNCESFNDKSFKETHYLSHAVVNDDFIGNPVRISKIDSLLYVVDVSTDSIIHLFDIKNDIYKGLTIGRGGGPNELLTASYVHPSIDNKSVWIYDITARQWMQYDTEELYQSKKSVVIEKIRFSKENLGALYVQEPIWISDSLFICVNMNSYQERFYIFNKSLSHIAPIYNPCFSFDEEAPAFILNDIFSTLPDVKPDKTKIVLAGRYFDCIEIYNADGSLFKIIKGPEKYFNFKYDRDRSMNQGAMIKSPDSKRAYICLKSTNNRIYVLYSGKEKQDPSNYSCSNIIYSFDWDGNPLMKYVLDCQVASFDIDEATQKIFAIQEPEKYIISFDM